MYISLSDKSGKYKKEIRVLVTEKQYRYLEVLALLKGKKGMSDTIRMIIEDYKKNNRI